MELGLSLGDSSASKPFGFLVAKKPPLIDISSNTSKTDLGFGMALGINSNTTRKSPDDDNTEEYSSEETIKEKNKELHLLPFAPGHRLAPSHQQSFPWSSDNGTLPILCVYFFYY